MVTFPCATLFPLDHLCCHLSFFDRKLLFFNSTLPPYWLKSLYSLVSTFPTMPIFWILCRRLSFHNATLGRLFRRCWSTVFEVCLCHNLQCVPSNLSRCLFLALVFFPAVSFQGSMYLCLLKFARAAGILQAGWQLKRWIPLCFAVARFYTLCEWNVISLVKIVSRHVQLTCQFRVRSEAQHLLREFRWTYWRPIVTDCMKVHRVSFCHRFLHSLLTFRAYISSHPFSSKLLEGRFNVPILSFCVRNLTHYKVRSGRICAPFNSLLDSTWFLVKQF